MAGHIVDDREGRVNRKKRVAVVYHMWPHYRLAVAEAMDRSAYIDYTFVASGEPYQGIKHADMNRVRNFVPAPFTFCSSMMWQSGALKAAIVDYDAIIYLCDMHFVSTWLAAVVARLRGIPVLFWGHGWLSTEPLIKRLIRKIFFNLASRMLVYGERAKVLGVASGYADAKLTVVYNSLDVARADDIFARIEAGTLNSYRPQNLFADPARPMLICTARITDLCRYDLLIDAAMMLERQGRPVNVLLVGDGPARAGLAEHVARLGISVHFFGACYDEEVLGQLIYHADLTVSPGKIGLTAMHSLMYGTPAITHGNLDEQMPEVEAIEPGRTGGVFDQGRADALATAITSWLDSAPDRATVRSAARRVIHQKWNPGRQAEIIEQAVLELTSA